MTPSPVYGVSGSGNDILLSDRLEYQKLVSEAVLMKNMDDSKKKQWNHQIVKLGCGVIITKFLVFISIESIVQLSNGTFNILTL